MSASVSDIQRRLDGLNTSDENYRGLLSELLSHKDLKAYIHSLQKPGLRGFIELLDQALNHIPITDDLFGKTLRRLQSTCANREVLPGSYLIQSEKLSDRGVPIAAGDFADTYEGELNGKKVCIKTLRSYVQDTGGVINKIFYGEVVVWKRLQHPNIVPFLGVPSKIPPPFEIVCEWMENSTICEYVRKYPRADRVELLWDVADGLHYLHSCGIVHGNLKGANVLIDRNGHACLTDFGLTSIGREETSRAPQDPRVAGTTTWAAPEILRGGAVTEEGDVFTFSMVAVETFTGHSPFIATYQSALYDIMSGKRPRRPETLSNDELWGLIQRCWDQDPGKRPTTLGLLEFFRTSFPGEREISNTHAIPSTPSAWTLKVPEVHKRNTQDVDEHTSEQYPPKQDKQDVNGPPTGGAKDVPGDRLDSSPEDVQISNADPILRVLEDDTTGHSSLVSQLWKAFCAKFPTVKVVAARDRVQNGGKRRKKEQGSRNTEARRGLLPILGVRRR